MRFGAAGSARSAPSGRALLADLRGHRLDQLEPPPDQHHGPAEAAEPPRRRRADPGPRTGDDHGAHASSSSASTLMRIVPSIERPGSRTLTP